MTSSENSTRQENSTKVAFNNIGLAVKIYPLARIINPERITIGSHVIIDDFVFIGRSEGISIGSYVHIASHASITGGGACVLGDFSAVASGSRILTGSDDFGGSALVGPTIPDEYRNVTRRWVILEKYTVLGANVVVLPGVTIGEGSVIGAGGVVMKDLKPWGVYVGSPAKRIKDRPKDIILQYEKELLAAH